MIRNKVESFKLFIRVPKIKCIFNKHISCKNQSRKSYLCPIQHGPFLDLLDFYCSGGVKEDDIIPTPMNPQAIPRLKCIEIALWFDDDFHALDAYCEWKAGGQLQMTKRLCDQFKAAWCRYYVRLRPIGVKRPKWLREDHKWRRVSVGYGSVGR